MSQDDDFTSDPTQGGSHRSSARDDSADDFDSGDAGRRQQQDEASTGRSAAQDDSSGRTAFAEQATGASSGATILSIGGPQADFVDVAATVQDELSMEAILRVLAEDVRSSRYDKDLVFNFGPMEPYAKQINEQVKNSISIPQLTEAVQFYVNKSFHQAVHTNNTALYETDGTPRNMKTVEGIKARVTVLENAVDSFKDNFLELRNRLIDAGYDAKGIEEQVCRDILNQAKSLRDRLEATRPMTLADSILMGAANQFNKLTASGDYAGDVRDYRNRRLNETLMQLRDIGADVRFNAGKPEWERADGKAAAAESERLFRDLMGLTKGKETQLNTRAINAQMEEILENFEYGAKQSGDADLRKRMKAMAEAMAALVERITNVVKRAFSRFDAPSPYAP